MSKEVMDHVESDMKKGLESLQKDLKKMRTGRASPALVESVLVDYYGSMVPINQVANITTPDARTIQISPWEAPLIGAIEKSLLAANLGFTPQNDGKVIRIPLPALTEERRKEMVKVVKKIGEEAKIGIRNHRREGNDLIKKKEKSKELSEDDAKKALDQVQKMTDAKIVEVDKIIAAKEKEILTV